MLIFFFFFDSVPQVHYDILQFNTMTLQHVKIRIRTQDKFPYNSSHPETSHHIMSRHETSVDKQNSLIYININLLMS